MDGLSLGAILASVFMSPERHEGQVLCTSCGRVTLGRSQNDEFEYRLETGSGLLILTLEYRVTSGF